MAKVLRISKVLNEIQNHGFWIRVSEYDVNKIKCHVMSNMRRGGVARTKNLSQRDRIDQFTSIIEFVGGMRKSYDCGPTKRKW